MHFWRQGVRGVPGAKNVDVYRGRSGRYPFTKKLWFYPPWGSVSLFIIQRLTRAKIPLVRVCIIIYHTEGHSWFGPDDPPETSRKKSKISPILWRACGVHLWGKRSDFFGIFLITGFDVPVTVWGKFYIFMIFRGRATQKLEKSEKLCFCENKEPRRYRPPGRLFARPMYGFQ